MSSALILDVLPSCILKPIHLWMLTLKPAREGVSWQGVMTFALREAAGSGHDLAPRQGSVRGGR